MSSVSSCTMFGVVLILVSIFGVYCHLRHHEVKTASRPEDFQADGTESVAESNVEQMPTGTTMVEQMPNGTTARTTLRTCGPYTNCGFQLYEQPDPFNFVPTLYIQSVCGDCREGFECIWYKVNMGQKMIVYNCQPVERPTTVEGSTTEPSPVETPATQQTYPPGSFHSYSENERKTIALTMVHVVLLRQSAQLRPLECQEYMPCGVQRINNGTARYFPYCPSCPDGFQCAPFETEINGWYVVHVCEPIRSTTTVEPTTTEAEMVEVSFPYVAVYDRRHGSMADGQEL